MRTLPDHVLAPLRHCLSAYLRAQARASYTSLYDRADQRDRIRLLSAAGPTAGKSFIASMALHGVAFSDSEWREALRWRLGIEKRPAPGTQCLLSSARCPTEEDICGTVLGVHADHEVACPHGPLRIQKHNELCDTLASFMQEAGAIARREPYVPEFSKAGQEAFLDVWAFGSPDLGDLLLDVTVRHPACPTYFDRACITPGHACTVASADKARRYPAAGGRSVTCFAIESWGRLGLEAEAVLTDAAAAAARRDNLRGRASPGRLQPWRAQLDAVLQ